MIGKSVWAMRQLALLVVVGSAAGALAWLCWTGLGDSKAGFLPQRAPAQWVLYPSVPDAVAHEGTQVSTSFKRSFVLERIPAAASLSIAGFRQYEFSVNDLAPGSPARRGRNWKEPDTYEVSRLLRAGTNDLVVSVINTNGPPALWLCLKMPGLCLTSDESWEASCVGATWRAAHPATKPRAIPTGSRLLLGERPWPSLQARWPWLLFAALLALTVQLTGRAFRLRWRSDGAEALESDERTIPLPQKSPWRRACREGLPMLALAGLWAALAANNLGALPPFFGFDSEQHLKYISYLQQHKALPAANQGWEMFQPPLYYLLAAGLLGVFHLSASEPEGLAVLQLMGCGIGMAHLGLVWGALRMLFPRERIRPLWGLVLASCLPPVIYLSQYVTNEGLAAAMVSACLLLTLRILKQERPSWKLFAGLGLCLGAALMAKVSAVLALPAVLGALLWRWLETRPAGAPLLGSGRAGLGSALGRLGLVLGFCLVVCGWRYLQLWEQFGTPLIGNWDARLGHSWWQEDGYRTSAFYLSFGRVLAYPWFGGLHSFADGIYSTLWGDGLLGGLGDFTTPPPWNCDLMAAGYWLALLPTVAVLAGGLAVLYRFLRQPSAEGFLLLSLFFLAALSIVHLSLSLPYYGHTKAFYGLSALVPFCYFGAVGMGLLAGSGKWRRCLVCLLFGVWAINSFAAFWVLRGSVPDRLTQSQQLFKTRRYAEAVQVLNGILEGEPRNVMARGLLIEVFATSGNFSKAVEQAKIIVQNSPDDAIAHLAMLAALSGQKPTDQALLHARRAVELAPGSGFAHQSLASLLEDQGRFEECIAAAREGLGVSPYNGKLHLAIGAALAHKNLWRGAVAHFEVALGLSPNDARLKTLLGDTQYQWGKALQGQQQPLAAASHYLEVLRVLPDFPGALNNLAWIRATSPQSEARNGTEAVMLAERACLAAKKPDPHLLDTLAAAFAEAGRFEDAVATATRARDLALGGGQNALADQIQRQIQLFGAQQPYREPAGSTVCP